MSIKIRLARVGAKKRPFYHIVIADARSPRDGRFIERIGSYDPMLKSDHPQRVQIKADRVQYWLKVGAQPTDRVARFLGQAGLASAPDVRTTPRKSAPKAKAQERAKLEAERRKAAEAAGA